MSVPDQLRTPSLPLSSRLIWTVVLAIVLVGGSALGLPIYTLILYASLRLHVSFNDMAEELGAMTFEMLLYAVPMYLLFLVVHFVVGILIPRRALLLRVSVFVPFFVLMALVFTMYAVNGVDH